MPRSAPAKTITALVVAGHRLAERYLIGILWQHPTPNPIHVLEPFENRTGTPDVLVVDSGTLGEPTCELFRRLRTSFPRSYFLAVGDGHTETLAFYVHSVGVHGFVRYQDLVPDLCAAVRALANGQLWFPETILKSQAKLKSQQTLERRRGLLVMTPREMHIFELLGQRLTNKEIAQVLGISEYTVKFHVKNIFAKTGARTRHDFCPGPRLTTQQKAITIGANT